MHRLNAYAYITSESCTELHIHAYALTFTHMHIYTYTHTHMHSFNHIHQIQTDLEKKIFEYKESQKKGRKEVY